MMLLKNGYEKLVAKVDNIGISNFFKKTNDTDKSDSQKKSSDADKKVPNTSRLVKITD